MVFNRILDLHEKELAVGPSDTMKAAFESKKDAKEKRILDEYKVMNLQKRNFDFADFSQSDLIKADLRNATLHGAILNKIDLREANIEGAHLEGTELKNAKLQKAILKGANFKEAKLTGAKLNGANLEGAELIRVIFKDANLEDANLEGANLQRAELTGANLERAQLTRANLNNSDLRKADLTGVNLQGANLVNANFRGTYLDRVGTLTCAQIESAAIDDQTKLPIYMQYHLIIDKDKDCIRDFKKKDLGSYNFQFADLTNVDLSGARLLSANLDSANLSQANLKDAKFRGAILNNADLRGVKNFTCEQLKSAVIFSKGQTKFPENFRISWSSRSSFTCEKTAKVKFEQPVEVAQKLPGVEPKVKEPVEPSGQKTTAGIPVEQSPVKDKTYEGMALIAGGKFWMGSDNGEEDEKPGHEVLVDDFFIDKYEVTQVQFKKVMGINPSEFKAQKKSEDSGLPVENVTWDEAKLYCEKLGKRLPTEAEWEKAARGETKTEYYWGDEKIDDYAWYRGSSGGQTHPVGMKKPNAFGLFDMSGNVWEWTADWYDGNYYKDSPAVNPKGPSNGVFKVFRGGSWYGSLGYIRSTYRSNQPPKIRNALIGFRCAW